jgi:hypothetical protein
VDKLVEKENLVPAGVNFLTRKLVRKEILVDIR